MSKNEMYARPRRAGDTNKQCWSLDAKRLPCLSATCVISPPGNLVKYIAKYYGCILCNDCFVVPLAGAPSCNHTLNNPSVAALKGRI